jgi:hypothetical protein
VQSAEREREQRAESAQLRGTHLLLLPGAPSYPNTQYPIQLTKLPKLTKLTKLPKPDHSVAA